MIALAALTVASLVVRFGFGFGAADVYFIT
jgi:hypothetical protein